MPENTIQSIPQRRFYDTLRRLTRSRSLAKGLIISENALRGFIRQGTLPAVRLAGVLLYYPNVINC